MPERKPTFTARILHTLRPLHALGLLVLPLATLLAQEPGPSADSLTRYGDRLAAQGLLDEAKEQYENALDINPQLVAALTGAGKCDLGLEDWGGASGYFDKVLDLDQLSVPAHYYLGICKRELGKTKAFLLRKWDWNKSADHFAWVLARDSSYSDVLYQYALLQECRKEYVSAIEAGRAQIRKRPDLPGGPIGLFKLYRSFIVNDNEDARKWLAGQSTDLPRYFLAEAYRRTGDLDSAEQSFRRLLADPAFATTEPVQLALARIAILRDKPTDVEQYFWNAVDAIKTQLGSDLVFEDIKYIISDEELELYNGLKTLDQKKAFFRAFWLARNPVGGEGPNERIPEHYRRLVFAEQNYEYSGFRTQFTNPDKLKRLHFPKSFYLNHEFNDMGLIYIRHGPPDSFQRSPVTTENPNESWLYEEKGTSPKRIFHFVRSNAIGSNWRLAPFPDDPALIGDIVTWDSKYIELLKNNAADQLKVTDQIQEQSQTAVTGALLTDNHNWKDEAKPFEVPYAMDRFRGKGPKALIDISYGIPISTIAPALGDTPSPVHAVVDIAMRSVSQQSGFSRTDTVTFTASKNTAGAYTGLYRYYMLPDVYAVSMHVRPVGTPYVGSWSSTLRVRSYPADDLGSSDIQLLIPSTQKTAIEIEGIKVTPSPFRVHIKTQPLYVYHHIYNLVKNADGETRYRIQYTLTPVKHAASASQQSGAATEDDGQSQLLKQIDETGQDDFVPRFQTLDVSDIGTGTYKLSVLVTDRLRVRTIVRSVVIEIVEP